MERIGEFATLFVAEPNISLYIYKNENGELLSSHGEGGQANYMRRMQFKFEERPIIQDFGDT